MKKTTGAPGQQPLKERAIAWRLLDTGVRTAAENIALDSVLLKLRAEQSIPNTLRFLKFSPPAVLIGFHQSIEQEARLAFCHKHGIDINRRITGGGAVFFDSSQIGWELVASRSDLGVGLKMSDLTERICKAAAHGLNLLGVPARFRPRNDIEVEGRKISGTGGAYEGDAFLFQGTLLVDFDAETMVKALKVPTEKLTSKELDSARERVACLTDYLPFLPPEKEIKKALIAGFTKILGAKFVKGDLTKKEQELLAEQLPWYISDDWINMLAEPPDNHQTLRSIHKGKGGLIRAAVSIDIPSRRIKSTVFTGDFFIQPRRTVFDLEARLKDVSFEETESEISRFFQDAAPDTIDLEAADFQAALRGALDKAGYPALGISLAEANHISIIRATPLTARDLNKNTNSISRRCGAEFQKNPQKKDIYQATALREILQRVEALLLPYCAKLPSCQYRYRDGCESCGDCTVGEAYKMAKSKGLLPIAVHNYEHLKETFRDLRSAGVTSYVGCCCQAFLVKRHQAFTGSGLDAVLVDIENATCYELSQEKEAYAGRFENQTDLRTNLLEKVLRLVPNRNGVPGLEFQTSVYGTK